MTYKCNECNKTFKQEADLLNHQRDTLHSNHSDDWEVANMIAGDFSDGAYLAFMEENGLDPW